MIIPDDALITPDLITIFPSVIVVKVPTPTIVPSAKTSLAVTNPTIFAVPLTSRISVGTEVPIQTNPLAFTIKLSSSTCTPFLKLNDFLKFAILYGF